MKREIKFRVWDNDNNLMDYLDFSDIEKAANTLNSIHEYFYNSYLKDVPPMQFTGLRDKNGVEIYEGDILRGVTDNIFAGDKVRNYEVVWGVDHWHIKGTSFFLQELINYCNRNVEVIGNVYEHSELLGSAGK